MTMVYLVGIAALLFSLLLVSAAGWVSLLAIALLLLVAVGLLMRRQWRQLVSHKRSER